MFHNFNIIFGAFYLGSNNKKKIEVIELCLASALAS
jgi:hypothetical protein